MPPLPELPPPDEHVLPKLATFLSERREHFTNLWVEALRANPRIASTDGLDYLDLADHLPRLFDDLADTLRGRPVGALVAQDSEGHGEHRWQQHYSLAEVTRELSVVCRLVLIHGLDAFREAHPEVPRPALAAARDRILDFFEEITAGSVRQYVRKQNEERDALHARLREADHARSAQVHSERDRLADVFRRSPSFIAVLSGPTHVFELTNDRYDQLVGRRDLLGKPVHEVLPELADQGFFKLLDRVYATGEPFVGNDVRVLLRSEPDQPAREHYVDFLFQPTRAADGVIDGVFVHGVDWTERKQLLEQNAQLLDSERAARTEAERTGRMKDEFLATLSHELRTPLNAILGWSQVLRGDLSNPEDLAQGLDTIERNARAQTQIIEDLLDMSRIISGKVRLDLRRLDLAGVIEAAVETIRPAADAKGVRLQPVIDPGARWVSGDPARLQQVFWNLLSNAVKFTPKGGRVQVVLERINSCLEVSVSDSGEGIAAEFLPHVFDRFRQADASTTRRHGGLGLGLAIVKQLIELHGGTVSVASAGAGQGTTFRVALPLRAVRPEGGDADRVDHLPPRAGTDAPTTPFPLPGQLRLRGVKVLVVDDEADARGLVKRLLEDREARVEVAGSAAEAMERFRAGPPDVLVSDIGMPGEDGYSLIRRVRALPPAQGGHTPALALTAYARSEDRLRAILAGFQMHLTKPVEPLELLATVASLAGRTDAVEH